MPRLEERTHFPLKNMLLVTDFPEVSETALRHAVGLARRYDATTLVIHVTPLKEETLKLQKRVSEWIFVVVDVRL
jgi:nucleotide-binding universal stress UspA family protein